MRARPARSWVIAFVAIALAGCSEVQSTAGSGYEPATVGHADGEGHGPVTFTREAARRTGLRTAAVRRTGRHLVVPYAALIYDAGGSPLVYAVKPPRTFVRTKVRVERVERGRALLNSGPAAGSRVVTVGAAEVYGTELGIAGGH